MKIFDMRDANLTPDQVLNAIRETVFLLSVPGMCESIKAGMTQPHQDLAMLLDW